MNKNNWSESRLERDARITETLAAIGRPVTVPELTRQLLSLTPDELVPRSQLARVTQSLRVMEREGIVIREKYGNTIDWRLARESTVNKTAANVKQVIVIRRDLKMRRGKEVSQGAHTSIAWLAERLQFPTFGDPNLAGVLYKLLCQALTSAQLPLAWL